MAGGVSDDPPSLAVRTMAGLESAEAPLRVGGSNPALFCGLWIASRSLSSGAHSRDPLARNDGYCETVCTTLETGRELNAGSFSSLASASSYSLKVWTGILALTCTTL